MGKYVRKRDRVPILTPGQVDALKTPEQVFNEAEEKIRAANLVRKQRQRAKERAAADQAKTANQCADEASWFASQRMLLSEDHIRDFQATQDYLEAISESMRLHNPYVKDGVDDELVSIVCGLVKSHGTIHAAGIHLNDELPVSWSSMDYWRLPEILKLLSEESEPTRVATVYNFKTALTDDEVVTFLTTRAGWTWRDAAAAVGWKIDSNGNVSYRQSAVFVPRVYVKPLPIVVDVKDDKVPWSCPDCKFEMVAVRVADLNKNWTCPRCAEVQRRKIDDLLGGTWGQS